MTKRAIVTIVGALGLIMMNLPSFAAPVLFTGNGHYYDAIDEYLTWDQAKVAAESLTFMGTPGHLATVTFPEEGSFITTALDAHDSHASLQDHWLGGFQPSGSSEPASGWSWVTGEPFLYTNWASGEPNNGSGNENSLTFAGYISSGGRQWNDRYGNAPTLGYVVEFDVSPVPEPGTLFLLGSGLAGLAGGTLRRRRRT